TRTSTHRWSTAPDRSTPCAERSLAARPWPLSSPVPRSRTRRETSSTWRPSPHLLRTRTLKPRVLTPRPRTRPLRRLPKRTEEEPPRGGFRIRRRARTMFRAHRLCISVHVAHAEGEHRPRRGLKPGGERLESITSHPQNTGVKRERTRHDSSRRSRRRWGNGPGRPYLQSSPQGAHHLARFRGAR